MEKQLNYSGSSKNPGYLFLKLLYFTLYDHLFGIVLGPGFDSRLYSRNFSGS